MTFRLPTLFLLLLTAICPANERSATVLAEINFARTQPQKYARVLETHAELSRDRDATGAVREAVAFLRRAQPLPPLAWSDGISQGARSHALDVGPRGGSGHSGTSGETPWGRMARHGQWSGHVGENIDYGHAEPRAIVIALIVDRGVRSRAHRANLFSPNFRVAGVAVAPHASFGTMCVMDFASRFVELGDRRVADRGGMRLRTEYSGKSFF